MTYIFIFLDFLRNRITIVEAAIVQLLWIASFVQLAIVQQRIPFEGLGIFTLIIYPIVFAGWAAVEYW